MRSAPDVIGNAEKVMRILTGEEPEDYGDAPAMNQAAAELGRKGGKKRAESMTPERRAEIAKKAAELRGAAKKQITVILSHRPWLRRHKHMDFMLHLQISPPYMIFYNFKYGRVC